MTSKRALLSSFVGAVFCLYAHGQETACDQNSDAYLRNKFTAFAQEAQKQPGLCLNLKLQKDLRLFSKEIGTLAVAEGEICFQGGRTLMSLRPPFSSALLLVQNEAFELTQAFGKKEFTYYSKVEETPMRNLAELFSKISKDPPTFWADFRSQWNCKKFTRGDNTQVVFAQRESPLDINEIAISFTETSALPQKLSVWGNKGMSVDIEISPGSRRDVPDFMAPPADANIKREN